MLDQIIADACGEVRGAEGVAASTTVKWAREYVADEGDDGGTRVLVDVIDALARRVAEVEGALREAQMGKDA